MSYTKAIKKLRSATTDIDISSAAAPSAGQVLTAIDDHTAEWQDPSGASVADETTQFTLFDDFCGGLLTNGNIGDLGWNDTGTGDHNLAVGNDTGAVGQLIINAGNGSGIGAIHLNSGITNNYGTSYNGPRGNETITFRLKPSSDTNVKFWFGIATGNPTSGGRPDRGIFFELDTSVSADMKGCCRDGSGSTLTTGFTPSTSLYKTYKIVINAAINSVEFYYDGSLIGTITTHIPTANDQQGLFVKADYNGANGKAINVDYIKLVKTGLSR